MTTAVEVTMQTPQETAALRYMQNKGYGNVRPYDQDKIDGVPCWYFYYRLPEGDLELEVFFDEKRNDWVTTVSSFLAAR